MKQGGNIKFSFIATCILVSFFAARVHSARLQAKNEGNTDKHKDGKTQNVTSDSYGGLTGMVNKLDTKSCKCVKKFEPCDVEMLEETVAKVEGKACSSPQRYCCQRKIVPMNSTENEDTGSAPLHTILRDEISNTDIRDGIIHGSGGGSATGNDPLIKPSTLGAILRLLTEGFKFLSNLFA